MSARPGWLGTAVLGLFALLQAVASGQAAGDVWRLITFGAVVLPSLLAAPLLATACYIVALTATVGRAGHLLWRMYGLVAAESIAAVALLWGWASGGFAAAGSGPLPRNVLDQWGGGNTALLQISIGEGVSLLLTPVLVIIAVVRIGRHADTWPATRQESRRSRALPLHVIGTACFVGTGAVVPSGLYYGDFESRHQPEVLVRELVEDREMRARARAYLIQMTLTDRARASPALLEALRQSKPEGQVAAASVLVATEADPTFVITHLADLLASLLDDTADQDRWRAVADGADLLASLGPRAAPAVPALVDHVRRPSADPSEQNALLSVIRALASVGEPAANAAPLLVEHARGSLEYRVRLAAAIAVDRVDPGFGKRCTTSSTFNQAFYQVGPQGQVSLRPECTQSPPEGR
jgi:hypothetical protein